ncbi:MAG: hypothetical protein AVDCRST_MAG13-1038, partial [uncultured Solirubrobacteraceae bacterium]
ASCGSERAGATGGIVRARPGGRAAAGRRRPGPRPVGGDGDVPGRPRAAAGAAALTPIGKRSVFGETPSLEGQDDL